MTTTFPPKPWQEGATFTNDTTGVGYTYQGGKWLASGGPAIEEGIYMPLKGDSTKTGKINLVANSGPQLTVNKGSSVNNAYTSAQILSDGTFETAKTTFSDTHLVTKKYTDKAIKDAVEGSGGLDTWTYVSESKAPPADGTFSFDSATDTFYISGITKEGKALTDGSSSFNEYNLVAPGTAYDETDGGVLRSFFKVSSFRVQSYGGKNYLRIKRGGYAKHQFTAGHDYSLKIAGLLG